MIIIRVVLPSLQDIVLLIITISSDGSMDLNMSKLCEIVKDSEAWHAAVHNLVTKQLMELSLKQKCESSFQHLWCYYYPFHLDSHIFIYTLFLIILFKNP